MTVGAKLGAYCTRLKVCNEVKVIRSYATRASDPDSLSDSYIGAWNWNDRRTFRTALN